ncbi:unnamed protein product, partial [Candidula unifasciata]
RNSDNLVAMGTLWIPISSSTLNNNLMAGSLSSGQGISVSSSSSVLSKTSILGLPSTNGSNSSNSNCNNGASYRKLSESNTKPSYISSVNGMSNTMFGKQLNMHSNKDNQKYQDPLIGAPASFQQRLMELASLEADTIRWERNRKLKKKPKQDRDS